MTNRGQWRGFRTVTSTELTPMIGRMQIPGRLCHPKLGDLAAWREIPTGSDGRESD